MNVYVGSHYRRQGIAREIVKTQIDEARNKKVAEVSLDATEDGRLLYQNLGFADSQECMVLDLGTKLL